jgi:ABC-2 type transport system permease protein
MSAAALAWEQFRLERKLFWRNPSAAFFNFILPLLLLVLVASVFASSKHELRVLIPGIAGMSVMATTFNALAFNLTFLREQGILKRIRGTPLPTGAWFAAVGANAVTNALVQVGVVLLVGHFAFGLDDLRDVPDLVVFVALGVVCFCSLGVAFSHVIPNMDSAPAYVNIVFLPLILLSGVFYDAKHDPAFLRGIAEALPLKHLIDGLSGAMVNGTGLGAHGAALGVLALWTAVGTFFAVRGFTWESRGA